VSAVGRTDRFAAARTVADALLYEGYLLYPYRASATKNQFRWQFGVVVPRACAERDPSERSQVRTEVVVDPGAEPVLTVRLRFLQVQQRTVVDDGIVSPPWEEAREHEIDLDPVPLLPLAGAARTVAFLIDGGDEVERDGTRRTVRHREPLEGSIGVEATWAEGPGALIKVAVRATNDLEWDVVDAGREQVMCRSLIGVHTLLAIDDGTFISSMDPPDDARDAVAGCVNEGTFPVLIGDEGTAEVVLSSPIILYDHPEVAPESPGDLYDATEIDEILALRVLTLTDDEKAEARGTDSRAAAIVDRCDDMPPELWERLHGAVRSLRPVDDAAARQVIDRDEPRPWWEPAVDASFDPFTDTLVIDGVEVGTGTSVRLRPSRRADAHDMFLVDMAATVTGVFTDVDGEVLVAVSIDDDPATEALSWQGRYLFFHPDEVEVLTDAEAAP